MPEEVAARSFQKQENVRISRWFGLAWLSTAGVEKVSNARIQ
jgi:hypothetical protein